MSNWVNPHDIKYCIDINFQKMEWENLEKMKIYL